MNLQAGRLRLILFLTVLSSKVYANVFIRELRNDDWAQNLRKCCFGDRTIDHGSVVVSHPERCYQLLCQNGYIYPAYVEKEGDTNCCEFNGYLYSDGAELEGHCMVMQCSGGSWKPSGEIEDCCDHCYLYDDPHIVTFDGNKYDYHGRCNYSVVQTSFATKPDMGVFSEFRACNSFASCLDRTTFRNDPNTLLTLENGAVSQIRVNGFEYEVQEEVTTVRSEDGKQPVMAWKHENCIFLLGSSNILLLHCPHRLDVWTHPINSEALNGLCGHYNGRQFDDFTDRDGAVHSITHWPMAFPHSWLTSEQTDNVCNTPCLGCSQGNATDPCKASEERRNYFEELCSKTIEHLTEVDDLDHYIETCGFDLCAIFQSGGNEMEAQRWTLEVEKLVTVVKDL